VNSGGAIRAILCPVGAGDKGPATDSAALGVLIPEYICFQRPIQRQDSRTKMRAADRERNRLRTDTGIAIIQNKTVAASQLQHSRRMRALACFLCAGVMRYREPSGLRSNGGSFWSLLLFMCVLRFHCPLAARPEKASCPIPAAYSGIGTLPAASGQVGAVDKGRIIGQKFSERSKKGKRKRHESLAQALYHTF